MTNEFVITNGPVERKKAISLMEELEPYRAASDLWKNMAEPSGIEKENFVSMTEILSDVDKPLVIISHDDADGWTSIAIIKLLREKLVGKNNIGNDILITLATGSEYGTCLDIFEKSNIPANPNILILDLNQDNPYTALSTMGLGDNLVARVDHHQTGKQELKAKIVPTEDMSFIDSTSLLTRIVVDRTMDGSKLILSEEVLSTFDNLALLGLVGDKKYEIKNRIGKAFAKMSNESNKSNKSLDMYNRISHVLNLMSVHPANLDDPTYIKAQEQIQEYLHTLSVINDEVVEKFENIEYIKNVSSVIKVYTEKFLGVFGNTTGENLDGLENEGIIINSIPEFANIRLSIETRAGFRGLKIVLDETDQERNIYDFTEPLWKSIYESVKDKYNLDFVVFAILENKTKLITNEEPQRVDYRVGVLKDRATLDEDGKEIKSGLHMNASTVAIITNNGGGHEKRAGDNIPMGYVVIDDDGNEITTLNTVDDLVEYMFSESISELEG